MIAGKKRSGKDTLGKIFNEILPNSKILRFADPMKQIIATTLNISLQDLEDAKNNNTYCVNGISYRHVLQRFGNEAMKPVFGDYVWYSLMANKIAEFAKEGGEYVIITDFRFLKELDGLEETFGALNITTINISRDGVDTTDTHDSEVALEGYAFDVTITNNDTVAKLRTTAFELFRNFIR